MVERDFAIRRNRLAHQLDGLGCLSVSVNDDAKPVQDFGIARLRAQHLPAYFLGLIGQTLPATLLRQRKDQSSGHELSGPQRARGKRSQVRRSNPLGFIGSIQRDR
jgi:hypothetical protein